MKNVTRLSFVLLTVLLITSCKKEPNYHYVSKEMQDLLGYQDKSYWIMKDSATGIPDSIACFGNSSSTFGGDPSDQNQWKSFGFLEYQPGNIVLAGWSIKLQATKKKNTSDLMFSLQSVFDSQVVYTPFLSIPFEAYGADHRYRDQKVDIDISPTMIINGQTFDNVYHLHYTFPGKSNHEHIYINKEVGFLKIVQDNELIKRTIEIVRWDVEH